MPHPMMRILLEDGSMGDMMIFFVVQSKYDIRLIWLVCVGL